MLLTDLAIKRPIFSISLSIIIMLMGLLSLSNLSLQQYPQVDEPVLTVKTEYYGASASLVESKVTTILENALTGLSDLDYIDSKSSTGVSEITLHFKGGKSVSEASSEIREHISQVRSDLPEECKEPTVMKNEANQREFFYLVLTSDKHDQLELYDYAVRHLKDRVETISGVANAMVYGNPYTMQILLDREKLKAYNLATTDILEALKTSSQELPAGRITKGMRYVNIVTATSLNSPEEMGKLVIKAMGPKIIQLKEVAKISLDRDSFNIWIPRFNGVSATFLAVSKTSGSNILDISQQIRNIVPEIQETLPQGMKLSVSFDFSVFIKAALRGVEHTIFEAIALVLAIIFLFLRSLRATFIPLVTIPISLVGSFIFLHFFHCSINTITLLAMVLAVGLVVDDAIVVLENIHRHIEEGMSPREAAFKGSSEIGFAIISMTITLASVYMPIAFIQGLTGQLFSEFAVALSGAVLISGVVALTLSPMMCSKLLLPHSAQQKNSWAEKGEEFFKKLDIRYQQALNYVLHAPRTVGSILLVTFVSIYFAFSILPQELAPQEDQGVIFSWTSGPEGATLESLLEYTEKVENLFKTLPESNGVWSVTNSGSGAFVGTTLVPWEKRKRSQIQIISDLRQKAVSFPGARTFVFPMQTLLTEGQGGLQIVVKTSGTYAELEQTMDRLVTQLKGQRGFETVSHDLLVNTPQLKVDLDRAKVAIMGVSIGDIGRTLETMLGGSRPSTFEMDGRHYDVIVKAPVVHQQKLDDIGSFYVKSILPDQPPTLVPITQFLSLEEVALPGEIKHFNKMRSANLQIDLAPSSHIGQALTIVKQKTAKILTPKMQMEYAGSLRKFHESKQAMYLLFLAAVLFIYLVLAIQFESFLDPLLILMTVPLSLTGALLALYLSGCTLNIYSQVGLITLVGLITKHGILIVEFANKQRDGGKSIQDAVIEAATLRLRPILMTTGAMVLGAVPLAFAGGAGAECRHQIGWVLVGGLLTGTSLTLFILPFIYKTVKELDLQKLKGYRVWTNKIPSHKKKTK